MRAAFCGVQDMETTLSTGAMMENFPSQMSSWPTQRIKAFSPGRVSRSSIDLAFKSKRERGSEDALSSLSVFVRSFRSRANYMPCRATCHSSIDQSARATSFSIPSHVTWSGRVTSGGMKSSVLIHSSTFAWPFFFEHLSRSSVSLACT